MSIQHTVIDLWIGIAKAGESFIPAFLFSSIFILPIVFLIGKAVISKMVIFIMYSLFVIPIMLKAYNVNKKFSITNDYLIFPASDVENSFIEIITLKTVQGLFYNKRLKLTDIEQVYFDGYGSQGKNFPLTVICNKRSNNLIFSSRQKRDEFYHRLTSVLDIGSYRPMEFGE